MESVVQDLDDDFDYDEALQMSKKSVDSDSTKNNNSKRNKIYQHIKKEIEQRAKIKPVTTCADQVFSKLGHSF